MSALSGEHMPEPHSSDMLEQCVDPPKLWSLRSVPYIPHIPPFLHLWKYTIVLPNWSRYLANELICYLFTVVTVSPHSCISFQFWSFSLIPVLWKWSLVSVMRPLWTGMSSKLLTNFRAAWVFTREVSLKNVNFCAWPELPQVFLFHIQLQSSKLSFSSFCKPQGQNLAAYTYGNRLCKNLLENTGFIKTRERLPLMGLRA